MRCCRQRLAAILAGLVLLLASPGDGWTAEPPVSPEFEAYVGGRLVEDPDDASAWRMLGKIRIRQNDPEAARRALRRAVELDPANVAARFDLGRLLAEQESYDEAQEQLELALELAPDSEYSGNARRLLSEIDEAQAALKQAGYEIRRFDGSQAVEPELEETTEEERRTGVYRPLRFRLEAGALYNSNVALAPLSRELSPDQPASAQGFLAPNLQWIFADRGRWRAATTFDGHFTVNESNFQRFNLQSYQPGAFLESFHAVGSVVLIPRVSYRYTHDEFEGNTFGNRHALTPSLWVSWNERDSTLAYWSIDHSDFRDDGVAPSITSQDGWTNVVGLSHDRLVDAGPLKLIRGGVDYTRADTRGSDFRFDGVHLFSELIFAAAWNTQLKLTGGWGFRHYPDFEFTPPRDENVWRAGAELSKPFTEHLSAALVFNYTLFDSKNPLFEAERYLAGLVTTVAY